MFQAQAAGVPVGQYRVCFTEWEQSVHESFGDRVSWKFEVLDGPHRGAVTSRYTGAKLTPKSALMKIARGLSGRTIETGDNFNPDDFLHREYVAVVGETDSGATRVESLVPSQPSGNGTPF